MISDGNGSLKSGDFVRVGDERTSLTSYARTFESAGLMIRFQCAFLYEMKSGCEKSRQWWDPAEVTLIFLR